MLIKDGVDGIDSGIWTRRILNEFWTLTSKADNSKSNACWNLTSSPPCTWTNIFLKAEWSYLQWKLTYTYAIYIGNNYSFIERIHYMYNLFRK